MMEDNEFIKTLKTVKNQAGNASASGTYNSTKQTDNSNDTMEYVKRLNPRPDKVITCHGDPYKAVDLASSIHRSYKIETRTKINLACVSIH